MPQQNLRRLVGTWNLVANSEYTFDIPRVQDIESLVVELDAVVTLTTAGTAVRAHAPAQLISRVSFVADGKDVLDDVDFRLACFGNYKRRFAKSITAPSTAGIAAHTVRAVAHLDRSNIRGWRPKDTAFQAWAARLLQLRITTGLATDLFTGSPVGTITSGTVRVYAISHIDEEPGEPKRVCKRTTQDHTFSTANSAQAFQLPVGNFIRLTEIMATDAGEPSDTLVNNIILRVNGVDVRHNMSYKASREINAADCEITQTAMPSGIAVVDSSPRGKFTDYYDLRGASLAELVLDLAAPSGTGKINLMVEEDIAMGKAAK